MVLATRELSREDLIEDKDVAMIWDKVDAGFGTDSIVKFSWVPAIAPSFKRLRVSSVSASARLLRPLLGGWGCCPSLLCLTWLVGGWLPSGWPGGWMGVLPGRGESSKNQVWKVEKMNLVPAKIDTGSDS